MGLQNTYANGGNVYKYVRKLVALAFLKSNKIKSAFKELMQSSPTVLKPFFTWFQKFYIGKNSSTTARFDPKFWSCYKLMKKGLPRSTNSVESWHRNVNDLIAKKHPGVLFLINFLKKEVKVIHQNLVRFNSGHPWHVRQKVKDRQREERLATVFGNRITMNTSEFLTNMSYNI